jgi:hypothetical protein
MILARLCSWRAAGFVVTIWAFIGVAELGVAAGWNASEKATGNRVEQAKREVYPRAWAAGFKSADETIDARGGMSVIRYSRAVEWRER